MSQSSRRIPPGNLSAGWALIKWARARDQYTTIALLYSDEQAVLADHKRSAQWHKLSGLRAMSPSARLEKTPSGAPYLDFGWRCYPSGANSSGERFGAFEGRADRIRIPIAFGGSNRGAAIRRVRRSREIWVLFSLLDSFDMPHLKEAIERLRQNELTSGLGLPPVLLPGLRIFDRFIPTGKEVAYWSTVQP
jgi:hypothetical protein